MAVKINKAMHTSAEHAIDENTGQKRFKTNKSIIFGKAIKICLISRKQTTRIYSLVDLLFVSRYFCLFFGNNIDFLVFQKNMNIKHRQFK